MECHLSEPPKCVIFLNRRSFAFLSIIIIYCFVYSVLLSLLFFTTLVHTNNTPISFTPVNFMSHLLKTLKKVLKDHIKGLILPNRLLQAHQCLVGIKHIWFIEIMIPPKMMIPNVRKSTVK